MRYMLIGEAYSAEEAKINKPFIGLIGKQLDRLLQSAGIDRENECFITNVICEHPPKNDFSMYYLDNKRKVASPRLIQEWAALYEEIVIDQPQCVICLGNEALRAVTGLVGIETYRGSIYNFKGIPVIGTFHPAAIMRGGGTSHWYLPATIFDLQRAKKIAEEGTQAEQVHYNLAENTDKIVEFFEPIIATENNIVAFDIETSMLGGEQIISIGFSKYGGETIVVPIAKFSVGEYFTIRKLLKYYMESKEIRWVAQNGYNFDLPMLKRLWDVNIVNYYWDTMVAHHLIDPEFPHDLATLGSIYTNIPYWKSKENYEVDIYTVNAKDALATYQIQCKEQRDLEARGLLSLYLELYHPLATNCLRKMSERGIGYDTVYQKQLRKELVKEAQGYRTSIKNVVQQFTSTESLERRLRRLRAISTSRPKRKTLRWFNPKTGKRSRRRISSLVKQTRERLMRASRVNVRSNKDLGRFLEKSLQIEVLRNPRTNSYKLDETNINKLYIKTQHPFLKDIIKLRQTLNKISKFTKIKPDAGDRVHTTYKLIETSRLSSGKFGGK